MKCLWEPIPDHIKRRLEVAKPSSMSEWIGGWCEPRRQLSVFITKDAGLWHLSIAHPVRYPSWDEIKAARYEFIPDDVYMSDGTPTETSVGQSAQQLLPFVGSR